ncbi:RCC1/BLIP-II protein, partial [Exidia glandulosa HHB12029]
THGALVDARGDVYQWGDGHFGTRSVDNREPMATLKGKDIKSVSLSHGKLYALSRSGRVFVLPVAADDQATPAQPSWFSWLWGTTSNPHYAELSTNTRLGYTEKFVSISAGSDHLLALTSSGRVFSHPVSLRANAFGQLGFRKFDVQAPDAPSKRIEVSLDAKGTGWGRSVHTDTSDVPLPEGIDDKSVHFCDKLYEVPALKDVKIAQAVAGERTSFVRTVEQGRVLAWGANDFGQLGLGNATSLPYVTVPSEVVLSRYCPAGTYSKCLNIVPGGDLTFFVVERASPGKTATIDLLAAGRGQWGALGNGTFSSAQAEPLRIRAVSGLTEYSEARQRLEPMGVHALSVSPAPSGHVLLTLDTISRFGTGGDAPARRDLLVWGMNQSSQLGNGARKSLATPQHLEDAAGNRAMLGEKWTRVLDLQGNVWGRNVKVEQRVVAGH